VKVQQAGESWGLRPASESDIEAIYSLQADREAAALAGVEGSFVDKAVFFTRVRAAITAGSDDAFMYVLEAGGRFAGYAGCFKGKEGYTLSYWIARDFWGRGAGTWMLAALFAEVPAPVAAGPMVAEVVEGNDASMRMLRRAGFIEVGARNFHCAVHGRTAVKRRFRREI
jgi:RimJ/RimL family protein N-acetyltransferase